MNLGQALTEALGRQGIALPSALPPGGDADGETARIYDILMEGGEHHHMLGDVYPETGDLEGDGYGDAIDGFDSEAMDVLKEMILGNLNTQPGPLPPPAR